MSGPAVVTATEVRIAAGAGTLIRRSTAILFVDGTDAAIVDAFVGSADAGPADAVIEAVTDALTAGEFRAPPFVLVAWDEQLHLVVFGAIEVRTDHPSLPMLSGAGSESWVERRLRSVGVATVEAGAAGRSRQRSAARTCRRQRVRGDLRALVRSGVRPGSSPKPGRADRPRHPPPLTPVPADPICSVTVPIRRGRSPATGSRRYGPRCAPATSSHRRWPKQPATTRRSRNRSSRSTTRSRSRRSTRRRSRKRRRLSMTRRHRHPDIRHPDIRHPDTRRRRADDAAPFVLAVRCGRGHVNPIHVTVCQTCGDLLEIGAPTETIRQPPLAMLELPSGETIAIDRSLVLGRRPDPDAAQAQDRAFTVVVGDEPSISRTHLRIDVEDWSLSVTDCGSRSGTAIVIRPGEEPRILEPWMTHELPVGARLFLGGPTSVVVRPIPARRSSSGG